MRNSFRAGRVLDMAGLSVPSDYDLAGGSLLALANGKGDPNRKDFVTAQYHSVFSVTGEFMLRQGDYKLITCKPNDRHPSSDLRLF